MNIVSLRYFCWAMLKRVMNRVQKIKGPQWIVYLPRMPISPPGYNYHNLIKEHPIKCIHNILIRLFLMLRKVTSLSQPTVSIHCKICISLILKLSIEIRTISCGKSWGEFIEGSDKNITSLLLVCGQSSLTVRQFNWKEMDFYGKHLRFDSYEWTEINIFFHSLHYQAFCIQ